MINCTAVMFVKGNFEGERFTMRLAPEAETAKSVVIDLAAIPQVRICAIAYDQSLRPACGIPTDIHHILIAHRLN